MNPPRAGVSSTGGPTSALNNNLGSAAQAPNVADKRTQKGNPSNDYSPQSLSLSPEGNQFLSFARQSPSERLGLYLFIAAGHKKLLQSLPHSPANQMIRIGCLNDLGNACEQLFVILGDISFLNEAVASQYESVSITPDEHVDKPHWLSNLGLSYTRRYEHLGKLVDIDNAIVSLKRAAFLSNDGQVAKPAILSNLSRSYSLRFIGQGDIQDIDKAIHYSTRAFFLTPDGSIGKHAQLHNLGLAYLLRFGSSGDTEDLDLAIEHEKQALSITPEGYTDKPVVLNDLGLAYRYRFEHLHQLRDIDGSIACHTRSVSRTQNQHAKLPNRLHNLGRSHLARFCHLGRRHDLDKAMTFQKQVCSMTPDGDPEEATRRTSLGQLHLHRSILFRSWDDFLLAIDCLRTAAKSYSSHPRPRFTASRWWAILSSPLGYSAQLPAYTQAMRLLPQVVWLGDTVTRRYDNINSIADIATEAASVAIEAGALNLALKWIEQGRSIVWKQMLQLRNPLEELAGVHEVLAQKLRQAQQVLDQIDPSISVGEMLSTNSMTLEEAAQRRRRSAETWSQLLEEVQQHPGFSDFMRPKNSSELMLAAHSGTVVVINVHENRCDALVLSNNNPIILVPLPSFSLEKATKARAVLLSFLHTKGLVARGFKARNTHTDTNFSEVLALLWLDVAKPILDALGYTKKPLTGTLPRITWCTTGPLSFLPLHAAGRYDQPGANMMDLVISSYTPNLETLLLPTTLSNEFSGLLAVGQSTAQHGRSALPGTVAELEQIKSQAGQLPFTQLDGENATVEAVLNGLDEHNWVHFACHGKQDPANPITSALYLHDGALDLATITRKSDKRGGFAFLSACQTATGDENMPDESVHLAAGMIMAGYSTVIATMWSVQDKDAPLIAKEVYARLLEGGKPDSRKAAEALHAAVQSLRAKVGDKAFMRWVPYVHMGI